MGKKNDGGVVVKVMMCGSSVFYAMQRQPLLIDVSELVSMASSFLEYKVSLGTILAAGTAAGGWRICTLLQTTMPTLNVQILEKRKI